MSNESWFVVNKVAEGVTQIAEPLHAENIKSYLVEGDRYVAVIDTGLGVGDFRGLVRECSEREPIVLLTHAHWDHIGGACAFPEVLVHPSEAYAVRRGVPNAMMRTLFGEEAIRPTALPAWFDVNTAAIPGCEPTGALNAGDRIELGGRSLEVLHTPGHSPGGVSLYDRATGILFAGDAINYGGIWLYLPRSDAAAYRATLQRLVEFIETHDVRAIYSAHADVPLEPAHVREARDAYEEIWTGERTPDSHEQFDIGFPERVPSDVFECGRFTFLLGSGRYGAWQSTSA